jgi:hypothetical protein
VFGPSTVAVTSLPPKLWPTRLGRDRGWAPPSQSSNVNVAVRFDVVHLVPEALEAEYWEVAGTASTRPPPRLRPTPPTSAYQGKTQIAD